MADPVVLTAPAIWLGGNDITGASNAIRLRASRAGLDDSRFGDGHEAAYPGRMAVDVGISGFYAAGAGEIDAVAWPRIDSDPSSWPLTVTPQNSGADGEFAYNVRGAQFAYNLGAAHGESLPFDLQSRVRSAGEIVRGRVVLAKAVRTATATGTARQLGALTAAQKMICVLHVFAMTGGSLTVTVESDNAEGFPSAATRGTFTAATGQTREVIEAAGAVTDDWWRVVATYTPGTNFTAAAFLGIGNV